MPNTARPGVRNFLALLTVALALAGCVIIGDATKPLATILVPATQSAAESTLVVVLPGFGADAQKLREHHIGEAIHQAWPQADVLLTSATFAYYRERNIIERLDQDVIGPAREHGYRQIWLAGASVGSMGVLFYEHEHPGALSGLILLAPWLGSSGLQREIREAGGPQAWEPGPVPATVDGDNYQREMWRVVKRWAEDARAAQRVWLICGTEDRMLAGSRLLAQALPPGHYLELPGGHSWETFTAAAQRVSAAILASANRGEAVLRIPANPREQSPQWSVASSAAMAM